MEALDRLGFYQYIDNRTPHPRLHPINGQGDPASVPNLIARSGSVHHLR